jgi:hypothetical protein
LNPSIFHFLWGQVLHRGVLEDLPPERLPDGDIAPALRWLAGSQLFGDERRAGVTICRHESADQFWLTVPESRRSALLT